MHFSSVIVIGFGKIAQDVVGALVAQGVRPNIVQSQVQAFSTLRGQARKNKLDYVLATKKQEIREALLERATDKTLVISANNNYLFPALFTDDARFTIVNFHNALLPNLRGRNAPSWAIFHGLTTTGITWHFVDSGVDTGAAIEFETVDIGEHEKAFELAGRCMLAALAAFERFIGPLLEQGSLPPKDKHPATHDRLYLSKHVPGEGHIDPARSALENYRILRALDYGPFTVFPKPTFDLDGEAHVVSAYRFAAPGAEAAEALEHGHTLEDESGTLTLRLEKPAEDGT